MSLFRRILIFSTMVFMIAAIGIGTLVLFNMIGEMIPLIVQSLMGYNG